MSESVTQNYNHLKIHSQYSICEGAAKIDDLQEYSKVNQLKSLGICDTSNLCGALEFAEKISKSGTQPIIGTQINCKIYDTTGLLPLFALNEIGYKNIIKLSSTSYLQNDNLSEPHIDFKDLLNNSEGVVVFSGTVFGLIGKLFDKGKFTEIHNIYDQLKKKFGDRFYIEIQRHNDLNEKAFEKFNLKKSSDLEIAIIATNEVFYISKDMHEAHDALICIGNKTYVNEKNRLRFTNQHYLKKNSEMLELFSDLPEALENNYNFHLRFNFKPNKSKPILPSIAGLQSNSPEDELLKQANEGLLNRLKNFVNSKNKVDNVVANLGTSLTTKQILTLNQFFQHIIICFDGDESGYKAALRAAENSIIELKPEKEISFLFLPNKHDPDSYVNEKGKDFFEDFSKNNSVPIHKFIFNHYSKEMNDNPSSRAIFETKLRTISSTIKDEFINKYVLEEFLDKISELTPNTNFKYKKNYTRPTKSLRSTQNYYNETKSFTAIDIKEFSFLYILLKKPELIKENFNLIENVKLCSSENKLLLEQIIDQTNNFENTDIESLKIDQGLIDRILKYASIKHILVKSFNDNYKILEILSELIRDLKNYELELRILDLESRFSQDLSETTFNELKELKKLQKIN